MTARRPRRAAPALAAAAALLLAAGCSGSTAPAPAAAPRPAQGGPAHANPHDGGASTGGSGGQDGAAGPAGEAGRAGEPGGAGQGGETEPAPRALSIPSLGITSVLERLGQQKDGTMETPRDPDKAGWYVPGPAPGAKGPAVIAGHVSWNGEPSVFHRLSAVKRGETIRVEREDGTTAEFTVERVGQYPKNRFPTVEVYKNIDHAGLRLITCGGRYDPSKRYYADNVVVFARLTGT
ncbi:class F sortase [Streptomyces sp. NPDC095602]|uniref:class F sortase n=1 Tax=Streptomyces sp. NPDC095602 TaxID=3155819 RepID=UPI003327A917